MGKLIFRYGTMNSGKSLNLLGVNYNYTQNGKNVFILKPAFDTRDVGLIKTRLSDELSVKATLIEKENNVVDMVLEKEKKDNKKIDVILVDEVQFLTKEHAKQLSALAYNHNKLVMCYGLKIDFLGNPFEASSYIMAHASNLEEIKTICEMCGEKKAIFHLLYINGKLLTSSETGKIVETSDTTYMQVCGKCYHKVMNQDKKP